jgi:protocatechuate 3,4-dioxygenase, beta subunit
MAIYSIGDLGRREILKMSAVLAGSGVVFSTNLAAAEASLVRTPGQILGPFYPLGELSQSSDLTRVSGRSGSAEGQVLNVMGRVLNLAGEPVRDARVEVWQANTYGRYTHPSDPNPAPLDPSFEGAAVLTTDSEGRYRFKTIKPAAYPAGPNMMRPAHIHFQVTGRQDRLDSFGTGGRCYPLFGSGSAGLGF